MKLSMRAKHFPQVLSPFRPRIFIEDDIDNDDLDTGAIFEIRKLLSPANPSLHEQK